MTRSRDITSRLAVPSASPLKVNRATSNSMEHLGWLVQTGDMETAVRGAVVEDAELIADAHVQGWRVGYRGLVPDE